MGQETADEGRFGYASRHLMITLDAARESPPGWRTCAGAAPRCRSARCCSTRGPSSSTTSATRARCPPSTRASSTAGSRWPRGCWSSPTGSSPRSATGCAAPRPRAPSRAVDDDPRIDPRELAAFLAGQYADAGLVAHRALRLDLRAAARARHHLARRARRRAARAPTRRTITSGWTTATRPAPYAASTTRCCRSRRPLRRPARQRAPRRLPRAARGWRARDQEKHARRGSVRAHQVRRWRRRRRPGGRTVGRRTGRG